MTARRAERTASPKRGVYAVRASIVAVVLATSALAGCGGAWRGGVQARLAFSEQGGLRVTEVPPRSAAARAGLRPGDRVQAIDDLPVEGHDLEEVVSALRGEVGTVVTLTVTRDGQTLRIPVERAPYRDPTRRR